MLQVIWSGSIILFCVAYWVASKMRDTDIGHFAVVVCMICFLLFIFTTAHFVCEQEEARRIEEEKRIKEARRRKARR